MPISLRIPPKKEELITRVAKAAGKTKTAFILDAVDEKLGLHVDREQLVRRTAGWLSTEDADKLKDSMEVFEEINEADWQ
jgi:uncharacterized protein (DUF1778 family)